MSTDPFANDPFATAPDEAQSEVQPTEPATEEAPKPEPKKGVAKKAPAKKAAPVEGDPDGITLTFKGGSGFDAPWIVIHASDLDGAEDYFTDENKARLASLMKNVQSAGEYFVSQAPAGKSQGGGGQAQGGGQRQPQQQAPNGETKYCKHGEMQFKTGVSKAGKAWKGFFCPTPKGTPDQCDAQFIR